MNIASAYETNKASFYTYVCMLSSDVVCFLFCVFPQSTASSCWLLLRWSVGRDGGAAGFRCFMPMTNGGETAASCHETKGNDKQWRRISCQCDGNNELKPNEFQKLNLITKTIKTKSEKANNKLKVILQGYEVCIVLHCPVFDASMIVSENWRSSC